MLNYIAIIPARKNSQRIKNKNTIKIKNKRLICYTIEATKKVKKINKIIVSTDDNKIIKLSKKKKIDLNDTSSRMKSKHLELFGLKYYCRRFIIIDDDDILFDCRLSSQLVKTLLPLS